MATRHARNEPGDVRRSNVAAFLDAAERLLVEKGYSAITTRHLAAEAGLNPGLVHYYFGSIDEVLVQVAERFTARYGAPARMYASDAPFLEKWRTATRYLEEDLAAGYPKVFFELSALSWNRPGCRRGCRRCRAAGARSSPRHSSGRRTSTASTAKRFPSRCWWPS